jgi:RNA polymerase subunit RPABC4/transcription elongation factor Spt4
MELMNCRSCKKLFTYITGDRLCPACKTELAEKYQMTKQYIEDNPDTEAAVVAEKCGVSLKQIKRWVREGQLEFADDSLVKLECERCGRIVHNGRYCKNCAGGLEMAMKTGLWMDVPTTVSGRL